jgi:hypothetical protein
MSVGGVGVFVATAAPAADVELIGRMNSVKAS